MYKTIPRHFCLMQRPMMLEYRAFEHLAQDILSAHLSNIAGKPKEHPDPSIEPVAFVPVQGILTKRASLFDALLGMTSYDALQETLQSHAENPAVHTIVLDIDSPGGEISGLFDLCDFILSVKENKKIIALINESAFSAGYAIASCADEILLNQTAGVGSIGVIATHIDQSGFDAKQGLAYTTVYAGRHKNDLNPHSPMTEEAQSHLQQEVDRLYQLLVGLVAQNRGLTPEQVMNTEAACFFGEDAISHHLADKLISFSEWIPSVTSLTHLERNQTMAEETMNQMALEDKGQINGQQDYRDEVLALARLCKLAKVPHKLAEFIEQNVGPEAARDHLLSYLAKQQQHNITNIHAPQHGETTHPLIDIAQGRAQGRLV